MTDNSPEIEKKRQIRSFVLRTGRKTPSQERAYHELWPKYGLCIADGMQDFGTLFGRKGDVVVEIGFGMGDSLAEMVANSPDTSFIGIEVHTPGVGRLMSLAEERHLTNLRIYSEDAVAVLDKCIPSHSLQKVQIFFPDPWQKNRHHKRRIIQPEFIQKVAEKLRPNGIIHLATDWEDYARHMMEVMTAAKGFTNQAGVNQYAERPISRPVTKFERRGLRLGHGVWDMFFVSTEQG